MYLSQENCDKNKVSAKPWSDLTLIVRNEVIWNRKYNILDRFLFSTFYERNKCEDRYGI